MDKISVLMPVRNGEKFLSSAITDITCNINASDEIIVIDDKSEDKTLRILEEWQASDSRVKVLKGNSLGIASALNLGLECASNNWIARFDVDDIYPAHRLTSQRSKIEPGVIAIFCDYKFIDERGISNLGNMPTAVTHLATSVSLGSGIRTPHPGVIFNKEAAMEVGAYDTIFPHCEDLSLWLRMSRLGKLISIPEYLLEYRLHPSSVSIQNRETTGKTRRDLMKKVGINVIDLDSLLSNLDITIDSYKNYPDFESRSILLIRELVIAARYHPKYCRAALLGLMEFLYSRPDINYIRTADKLRRDKVLRNLYRES
jgi:glycosyltransferase involved in cell wall biosynthesis